MEKITIGKCTICDSPIYMCIENNRYNLSATCTHKGILKFIDDMFELDPQCVKVINTFN